MSLFAMLKCALFGHRYDKTCTYPTADGTVHEVKRCRCGVIRWRTIGGPTR